jgi:hypothetical protein
MVAKVAVEVAIPNPSTGLVSLDEGQAELWELEVVDLLAHAADDSFVSLLGKCEAPAHIFDLDSYRLPAYGEVSRKANRVFTDAHRKLVASSVAGFFSVHFSTVFIVEFFSAATPIDLKEFDLTLYRLVNYAP